MRVVVSPKDRSEHPGSCFFLIEQGYAPIKIGFRELVPRMQSHEDFLKLWVFCAFIFLGLSKSIGTGGI